MPNYRRAYTPGGTYFFTVVTYKRYPVFKNKSAIDLLQRCFQTVTSEYPFDIDAFVILPDHLHYIWTLPPNDSDFSTRWKRIKALFTRYYTGASALDVTPSMIRKGEKGIWQRRFWEHKIRDEEDLNRHCDYIHYNPVKHGLVSCVSDWTYSSFGKFIQTGKYSKDWGMITPVGIADMNVE